MNVIGRVLVILVVLLATACNIGGGGELLPPPILPNPCSVKVGESASFSVGASYDEDSNFQWQADSGTFSSPNEPTTTYTPDPEVAQRTVTISYAVINGGVVRPSQPVTCSIVADPTPTPSPMPTPSPTPVPPQGCSNTFDEVMAAGRFRAIIRQNSAPFAFPDGDGFAGFEVDLMIEFARRWFENPGAVEFVPVPSPEREVTLDTCEGDIIAATYTKTGDRGWQFKISSTYFLDGARLLVRLNPDGSAPIAGICDLDGTIVGVIENSTGAANLRQASKELCEPDVQILEASYGSAEAAASAVAAGQIAAFTTDGILLEDLVAKYPTVVQLVGNNFSKEPYGLASRQLPEQALVEGEQPKHPREDGRFNKLVEATLQEMKRDGTFDAIFKKWFPDQAPYPIEEIPGLIYEPRELITTDLPPAVEPVTIPPPPPTHVVAPGEWLSTLANRYYGNSSPDYWRLIYEANSDKIDNPDNIPVGTELVIPELPPGY